VLSRIEKYSFLIEKIVSDFTIVGVFKVIEVPSKIVWLMDTSWVAKVVIVMAVPSVNENSKGAVVVISAGIGINSGWLASNSGAHLNV
jgi:hypothetical protein